MTYETQSKRKFACNKEMKKCLVHRGNLYHKLCFQGRAFSGFNHFYLPFRTSRMAVRTDMTSPMELFQSDSFMQNQGL